MEKNQDTLQEVSPLELYGMVMQMIDALKGAGTPYAGGVIRNTLLTDDFKELLLFVGITAKQVDSNILFAWTETVKSIMERNPDEKK